MARRKQKHKSKEQEKKNAIKNTKQLDKGWKKVIKLFDDYTLMASEAKYRAKHGKGLKILTPKQLLQGLQMALPQLKAVNISENFLNGIRKSNQASKITQKVFNNNEFSSIIKKKCILINAKNVK